MKKQPNAARYYLREKTRCKCKEQEAKQQRLEDTKSITFAECATSYIEANRKSWKNAKHAQQWQNTINSYANPILGALSVSDIDTNLVLQCIEPIWQTKTETATRVRGRIETVLDWATVRNYRTGENPARWRGHLDKILPSRAKIQTVKHHAALPFKDMPDFMTKLRKRTGVAALALEFIILTSTRTTEAVQATWDEMDIEQALWIIPAHRMKNKKEHRVPLCNRALEILLELQHIKTDNFVFQGSHYNKSLSTAACTRLLQRMDRSDITVHGFRSTFRDWASECTNYSEEVKEMAMSHTISNKAESAYRRGDLLEKRRNLMQDWQDYCG